MARELLRLKAEDSRTRSARGRFLAAAPDAYGGLPVRIEMTRTEASTTPARM